MNFAASSPGAPTPTLQPVFQPGSSQGEQEGECVNCLLCVSEGLITLGWAAESDQYPPVLGRI